jgi:hypothetical protein
VVSNQSTGSLRAHATLLIKMRNHDLLPSSIRAGCLLPHDRVRNPCPTRASRPRIQTTVASKARNPCDSVMVNNLLELIHKRSYVALRSVRRRYYRRRSKHIKFHKIHNSPCKQWPAGRIHCILMKVGSKLQPGSGVRRLTIRFLAGRRHGSPSVAGRTASLDYAVRQASRSRHRVGC